MSTTPHPRPHPGLHPAPDALYDANAEYYDTITAERVAGLDPLLVAYASAVDPSGPPLLDVGAGTGRLTVRLARLVEPCEIVAVEPGRGLRAVLASRLAEDTPLGRRVTVVPHTLDDAIALLPDELGGAIAFGVLPHLDPAGRQRLLTLLAQRLRPGAAALVEVMPPWTAERAPLTPMGGATAGRHRIECDVQAEPVGEQELLWTMSYRRIDEHGTVLHEARASNRCWVVDPATFAAEAERAGLDVTWPTEDIARLTARRR